MVEGESPGILLLFVQFNVECNCHYFYYSFFFGLAVRPNPRSRVRDWWVQMRVYPRLRVPIRRPHHLLRWSAYGGRVQQHREGNELEVKQPTA